MTPSGSKVLHFEESSNEKHFIIYPSTCRICLKTSEILTSLLEGIKDSVSLFDEINHCFNLDLNQNDDFPTSICKNCVEQLDTSVEFRKRCVESNDKLNNKFQFIKIVKLDNVCDTIEEDCVSLDNFSNEEDSLEKLVKIKKKTFEKSSKCSKKKKENFRKNNDSEGHCEAKEFFKSDIDESELLKDSYISQHGVHQCKSCGKMVSTKAAIINHLKSHSGPMNCPSCNKKFSSKKLCTRHYKNVHLEYLEKCPVCGRSFKLLATLQTHMKTHSSSKPFCCQYCGRGFLNKHNMLMHQRSHLQLKEFCCHLCGMAFVTPGALRLHNIRKHAKVRPYPCSFDGCSLAFAAKSELSRHEGTHTAAYKHTCTLCFKGFKRTDVFNKHMRKEHGLINGKDVKAIDSENRNEK